MNDRKEHLMSEVRNDVELSETQLGDVQGGLLLPAVQKVREAASRLSTSAADGSVITAHD